MAKVHANSRLRSKSRVTAIHGRNDGNKKPGTGPGFVVRYYTNARDCLPGRMKEFRSARTRSHSCSRTGAGEDDWKWAGVNHHGCCDNERRMLAQPPHGCNGMGFVNPPARP
jgi:hypothetical protein